MYDYIKNLNIDFSEFEIICVPLHKKKQRKRGFNQCELISKDLSLKLNIPYNFNLIKRIENLKDAFCVEKAFYNGNYSFRNDKRT